ncbi:MAG TPA: hypothetical protein VF002_08990 [Gaiellaceae bacterium]
MELEPVLAALEQAAREAASQGEETGLPVALAFLAGAELPLDPRLLNAARRRALFLLAAGGDPHRSLELDGRAVTALAGELDSAEARAALRAGLDALRGPAKPFPQVAASLSELLANERLAWQAYAAALLAEELAEDE